MKKLIIATILLCLGFTSFTQNSPVVGDWEGEIDIPGAAGLGVIFHIKDNAGSYSATMDVPLQGAKDIAASEITISGNDIALEFSMLQAKYRGKLNKKTIAGTWYQAGKELALNLKPSTGENGLKRPQTPKAPFDYVIKELSYSTIDKAGNKNTLSGTLTKPQGEGPFPTAILVSGSGPQDRDETILGHKPFWVIADYMAKNGVAVFRYDDRGVAKSTGDFASATTMDFKDDALAVLNQLKSVPGINAEQLGFIGHSEGAMIAAIAASESSAVKFAVMLGGPAVPGKSILQEQTALIAEAEGRLVEMSEDDIEKEKRFSMDLINLSIGDPANIEERKAAAKKHCQKYYNNMSEADKKEAGDFDSFFQQMEGSLFSTWMQAFLKMEPKVYIERIPCPTLALYGAVDLQVPAASNVPAMKAALDAAPTERWEVVELPMVNHLFQHSKTGVPSEYGKLPETFANEALVKMRDFIKEL